MSMSTRPDRRKMRHGRAWFTSLGLSGTLALALAFLVLGAASAAAARTAAPASKPKPQAPAGAPCDGSDASVKDPNGHRRGLVRIESPKELAAGAAPADIAAFFADKAKEVVGKKVAELGMQFAEKLIGLNGGNPDAEILSKLDQINTKLDDIESRLTDVKAQLTEIEKKFDEQSFQNRMDAICKVMIDQERLYRTYYVPMIQTAAALGQATGPQGPAGSV